MANRKVILVRLCKTEKGWRRYPAVIGKNGRIKPRCVVVDGKEREYPEGKYQLRTYEGSRMVYRDAGENAAAALTAQTKTEHLLEAKAAAKEAGVKIEEVPGRLSLARELNRFVQAAEDRGSNVAAAVYRTAVEEFLRIVGKTFADEITPEDILLHQRRLRGRDCSPRTIANRHASVTAFLRHCKLDVKALAPAKPKYEKTVPEVYATEELRAFFGSIEDERLYLIFEILLKCGLRDQEAVYLTWDNIDFATGTLRVRSKPEFDFKIKDKEERDIPIPADLLKRLKSYREQHPVGRLVTGTATDKPNHKLLRTLKRLVKAGGLNCGLCSGCRAHKECERWWLHKFRATRITRLLQSGMDLRTVMKFSGHSDLDSVMRYLSPAADAAIKAHIDGVEWM
jgi:integrase